MNFKDRVAIVTGAASGIGRATAIQLAKKKCRCNNCRFKYRRS